MGGDESRAGVRGCGGRGLLGAVTMASLPPR
jgi:hypothetical protein